MRIYLITFLVAFIFSICSFSCVAQPYFDVAGVTFWHQPTNDSKNISETYLTIFLGMPVNISKNLKLVASPFYEARYLDIKKQPATTSLYSTTLPLTLLWSDPDSSWSVALTGIYRSNATLFRFTGDVFQAGGAILATFRMNKKLSLKAGMYYNQEFFSDFFVPLLGIDWKASARLRIFGTLPSQLRVEHTTSKRLHTGVVFKSITNSYRDEPGDGYFKIEDNHLGLYADYYIAKNLVWMIEAGHTLLRSVKFRGTGDNQIFQSENDNLVFKTGIYHRIKLD